MKHRILSMITAGCFAITCTVTAVCGMQMKTSASDDALKIMAVGDSITHGYINNDNGYRKYLCYYLQQASFTNYDMVGLQNSSTDSATYTVTEETNEIPANTVITYDPAHEGYSGYSIQSYASPQNRSGIYETLFKGRDAVKDYDPDVIFLQIGTNDILDANSAGIQDRLDTLIERIEDSLSTDAALFVASIPDIDPSNSAIEGWLWAYGSVDANYYSDFDTFAAEFNENYVHPYNELIKELVEEKQAEGDNIYFADINSVVDVDTGLYDGVHPNEYGYACMGEYWASLLMQYINEELSTGTTTTTTTTTTTDVTTTTEVSTSLTESTTSTQETTTEITSTEETSTTTVTETITEDSIQTVSVTTAETTETTLTETETNAPKETDSTTSTTTTTETTSTETTDSSAQIPYVGDINSDGETNLADLIFLQEYLLSNRTFTYDTYLRADLSQDSQVNGIDLSLLRQVLFAQN